MKIKKLILFLLFCVGSNYLILAQEKVTFSLEEAIKYGLQNNANVKNAETDIEIARKKIMETTAIGLPQIDGKISNTNYINIATTLMPDFITPAIYEVNKEKFGLTPVVPQGETQYFPANFGTKYNASAEISVSQLIFNGSYIVGLQAARAYLKQSKVQSEKNKIDIEESITKAYFLALVTQKNKAILDSTYANLQSLYNDTKKIHEQGFIEDTEVEQIELMLAELETNLIYVSNQIKISKSYLKVLLGIEVNTQISLTDALSSLIESIKNPELLASDFLFKNHIDYRIVENQRELARLDLKNEYAKSLPVIAGFFTAQTNAMRGEFDFFDSEQPWYPTTLWGFQMDIPIFSSFSRSSKVQQKKMELKKIDELRVQLQNNLNTEEDNIKTNFTNALSIHKNKKNATKLAKRIYDKTQVKYKEGVSSNTELLQMYNQYLESEGNYISSIVDLVNAKLALEKLFK